MFKHKILARHFFALLIVTFLAGCQNSLPTLYRDGIPGTANWGVLPFVNSSGAESVNIQVERMLMVMLPSAGVDEPRLYPESAVTTASDSLADAHKLRNARQWALQNNVNFAFSGSVNEWKYDSSGRPRVAVSLKVTDIRTGDEAWNISGASEGLAGDDLHDVCRGLIADLLKSLPVQRRL
ncbi:MAG: hypothetical protein ACR2PT_24075 [Endozoicomonas sp.]